MSFWRLYYHIVWGTKHRLPMLDDHTGDIAERAIRATAMDMGVVTYAIGIMPEHVHLVAGIPPRHSIAEVMRRMKGGSSHLLTQVTKDTPDSAWIGWQLEYGVLSFGERSLDQIVRYVENQREHHLVGDLMPMFEKLEEDKRTPG